MSEPTHPQGISAVQFHRAPGVEDWRVTGPAPPDGPIRVGTVGQWRITRAQPGTCQGA